MEKKIKLGEGFDVSSLSSYKDEINGPLFGEVFLDTPTLSMASLQKGMKGTQSINLVDTSVSYTDDFCSDTTGNVSAITFTQRDLEINPIKAKGSFCEADLRNYWAGFKSSDALSNDFSNEITAFVVEQVQEQIKEDIDSIFWQGNEDTAISSSILGAFDGMYNLLSGETFSSWTGTTVASTVSYTNIDSTINEMVALVGSQFKKSSAGLTAFMSVGSFETLKRKLIATNYYDPQRFVNDNEDAMEMVHPIYKYLTIKAMPGMGTQDYIWIMPKNNMFIGIGGNADEMKFDAWYSMDDDKLYWRMKALLGLQVARVNGYIVTNYDY